MPDTIPEIMLSEIYEAIRYAVRTAMITGSALTKVAIRSTIMNATPVKGFWLKNPLPRILQILGFRAASKYIYCP